MPFFKPIIILGAPRSGTTILHRCLAVHPQLWHLTKESHFILEGPFHPRHNGYESNRVDQHMAIEADLDAIRWEFYKQAVNYNRVLRNPTPLFVGNSLIERGFIKVVTNIIGPVSRLNKPQSIRFLEKTPKNSLRIPLLKLLFPDALFIWNVRHAPNNIDSLISGWNAVDTLGPFKRQRFAAAGYPIATEIELTDYDELTWKFALVPGWRTLSGKHVGHVAAWQYYQCNQYIQQDLLSIPPEQIQIVKHEEFVTNPIPILKCLLQWAGLPWDSLVERFANELPLVNSTRLHQESDLRYPQKVAEAMAELPDLQEMQKELGYL